MYGDLSIDPAFNVYHGIIDPAWSWEDDDEEEVVPEWRHRNRRKPKVIRTKNEQTK